MKNERERTYKSHRRLQQKQGNERTSIHAFRHWWAKKSVLNGVNIVGL
ncbi:hypothetical protein [Clostridium beijerinckii]|nr:hypothetical protein [Clostridium beijerinckii]NRZ26016.1 hypothetical protein [Clostridium beijerinckii]